MKKIFVKAFLEKNLGDDIMLIELFRHFPNFYFYLSCSNRYMNQYKRFFSGYPNVEMTGVQLYQISVFGNGYFAGIVQIGGSILQGTRLKGCFYRWRNICAIIKQKKYGTFYNIIGCNTGPFINKVTQKFVEAEIKSATCISLRDRMSFDYVKGIHYKGKAVYADDIVMGYVSKLKEEIDYKKEQRLGISVMLPINLKSQKQRVIDSYIQLADHYILKTGNPVSLLCFNMGSQDDYSIAKAVKMGSAYCSQIKIICYQQSNIRDMINNIAQCSNMIAVRFHSLIIGCVLNLNVFPISYSEKTENILDDWGYTGCRVNMKEFLSADYDSLVNNILSTPNVYAKFTRVLTFELHFEFLKNKGEEL